MTVDLSVFPRRRYTQGATPIQHLPHFSKALGDVDIYIKRDDLLGLTCGGNKTRKLEFLMADALAQGADAIVTCGAVQSNHCRLTLAAAIREGLPCHLALEEKVPNSYRADASGSLFLLNLLGTASTQVFQAGTDMMAEMQTIAENLKRQGHTPYIIPFGGSNERGALGYVDCFQEITAQLREMDVAVDHMAIATGSTASMAGLLAGRAANKVSLPITGFSINKKCPEQQQAVHDLAQRTLATLGLNDTIPKEDVVVDDRFIGPGYARPSVEMVAAVRLMAHTEGILLDPVYTGKAVAGLIAKVRDGSFPAGSKVLYIHTGGSPALFAYEDAFLQNEQ